MLFESAVRGLPRERGILCLKLTVTEVGAEMSFTHFW